MLWRTLGARLFLPALMLATPAHADILLIGNKGEDSLSLVDTDRGQLCHRLPTDKAPHEVAVSPDGRRAAVVGYGAASVEIFDIHAARSIRRIGLGDNAGPHGLVWLRKNQILTVADRGNALIMINPETGTYKVLPTGQKGSHMLTVSPDRKWAYVSNILSGTVGIFDIKRWRKVGDIAVGGNPEGIAITPDGKSLWVGDNSGARVKVVDLKTQAVTATLPADSLVLRLLVSADGQTVIASNFQAGTLTRYTVQPPALRDSIVVSGAAKAMQVTLLWSSRAGHLWVAETGQNSIAEVDLNNGTVVRRVAAGKNGDGLALAPGSCQAAQNAELP